MKKRSYLNKLNNHKFININIETRFNILMSVLVFAMVLVIFKLFYTTVFKSEYYQSMMTKSTLQEVSFDNAPRGKIYDRNHNVIVDNVVEKTIYYQKPNKVTMKEELALAKKLNNLINIPIKPLTENELASYWMLLNPQDANKLLTDKEKNQYRKRKITDKKRQSLILKRIITNKKASFTAEEKEILAIYKMMNKGYSYVPKVIKNANVTDKEYLNVMTEKDHLGGITAKMSPSRYYPYGQTFKTLLGKVSTSENGVYKELKDIYLGNGYQLNDQVGISNLELAYENILRGQKPVFQLDKNNNFKIIKKGKRGNDIVLTIDIKLQQYLEQVLINEIKKAKTEPNTKYYNRSFVIITDPRTGEILAMAGKQIKPDGKIIDFTTGVLTQPVTAGSVVKGASSIVGYNANAIKIGARVKDECIRLKATPEKCSWKNLGIVDDIQALAYSSNSFQFKTAILVAGSNYKPGGPLIFKKPAFDIYRQTYNEFGLGVPTNLTFAKESVGNKGSDTINGQLLDFAIGQYDTYTPMQISSYINTIASRGNRYQLELLKAVYEPKDQLSNLVYHHQTKLLNVVNTNPQYLNRVIEGFKAVMDYGTGVGYMGNILNPAGKTGTSQSFIDTDNDGRVDTETLSNAFVGFAPYNNPQITITVVSPDVKSNSAIDFKTGVNKRIASAISNYLAPRIKITK